MDTHTPFYHEILQQGRFCMFATESAVPAHWIALVREKVLGE